MLTNPTTGKPSVNLHDVLQLALPQGSRLLAGATGLSRRVHWARVLGARPAGLGTIEPGEILLLAGALLNVAGDGRALRRVISDLLEAGVSAFVVAESPP